MLARRAWLLAALLGGCGGIQSALVVQGSTSACQPVPVRLVGQERVQRVRGHAHSRFGFSGEDRYSFDGFARIAGKRFRLVLDGEAVLAAFLARGRSYVLAQDRLGPEWGSDFVGLSAEKRTLEPARAAEVPVACQELSLRDPARNRLFTLWRIGEAAREDAGHGCQLFIASANTNPRFAFQPRPPENRPDTVLPDLLDELRQHLDPCDQRSLAAVLRRMLESSKETDWVQDVRFVASALLRVEGAEVLPYLVELRDRFRSEDPASLRAKDLDVLIELQGKD